MFNTAKKMHILLISFLLLMTVISGVSSQNNVPPLDRNVPKTLEKASFALG